MTVYPNEDEDRGCKKKSNKIILAFVEHPHTLAHQHTAMQSNFLRVKRITTLIFFFALSISPFFFPAPHTSVAKAAAVIKGE